MKRTHYLKQTHTHNTEITCDRQNIQLIFSKKVDRVSRKSP